MNYTDEFLAAVKHLAQNYVLSELHPAMVAQWILESDRGNSKLAREFRNFAGMKWRDELIEIGSPRSIKVPSEPGVVKFTWFENPLDFVRGFFKFLDRSPYAGWRLMKTPEEYIEHIGKTWATDPIYIRKVKALFPEANELIARFSKKEGGDVSESSPENSPEWFRLYSFSNRFSNLNVIGFNGSAAVVRHVCDTTEQLAKLYELYGEHRVHAARPEHYAEWNESGFASLPISSLTPAQEQPAKPESPSGELKGLRVFLEAGHGWSGSSFDPGAVGHVQEWTQNKIQATACAEWLRARGAEVRLELYEKGTPARDLRTRGRIGGGSDVFISFHHNAFNGKAQGTETCIDRLADKDDIKLAEIVQTAMMRVSPFTNRGPKQQGLGVLRGAKPGAFAACLTEAYFVDGPGIQNAVELDKKLGIAVAEGIAEFAKIVGKLQK